MRVTFISIVVIVLHVGFMITKIGVLVSPLPTEEENDSFPLIDELSTGMTHLHRECVYVVFSHTYFDVLPHERFERAKHQ